MKIPSNRSISKAHPSLDSFLSSKEENADVAPLIHKRKRSSPKQSNLAPKPAQKSSVPSTTTPSASVPTSAPLSSGQNPSLVPKDHLTLKKLKASYSQEFKSQSHISIQTPTPAQTTVNIQPTTLSQSINKQPILSQSTTLVIYASLPEVVDIEDSNEKQGLQSLQANIFNEISSSLN